MEVIKKHRRKGGYLSVARLMPMAMILALVVVMMPCPRTCASEGARRHGANPNSSFLERFNDAVADAAVELVAGLVRNESVLTNPDVAVDIGVFPVALSDGGVLEIGRLARAQITEALQKTPGIHVMGELAYLNAPYAVKCTVSLPVQGMIDLAWTVESRDGDVSMDYRTVATANSRIRLPGDPASTRNLLLYVKRPEGKPELPVVDVPLLRVGVDISAVRLANGKATEEIALSNGGWLASDDQFRVCLTPNTDCHAYIFIRDSAGDLYSLFPSPGVGLSNKLEGGIAHWVPEVDRETGVRWFYLDDNPGRETLYIVADYEPIGNVEALLARVAAAGEGEREVEGTLAQWAVQNREESNRRFRVFGGEGTRELEGYFSVIEKFTIEHR